MIRYVRESFSILVLVAKNEILSPTENLKMLIMFFEYFTVTCYVHIFFKSRQLNVVITSIVSLKYIIIMN